MNLYTRWRYWKTHRTPLSPTTKGGRDPIDALEEVVADFTKLYGTWEVAWGEMNRLERTQSGGEEPFSD